MSRTTHTRARDWAAEAIDAQDVGAKAKYHLRDKHGRRVRVAGRHVRRRQPNFFSVGESLTGDPFDDLVVVLFNPDWTIGYAYRLPIEVVRRHAKQPAARSPDS